MPNTEEILKQIEEAAKEGAKEGVLEASKKEKKSRVKKGAMSLLIKFLIIVCIIMLIMLIIPKLNPFNHFTHGFFDRETVVEDHDMTIENHGVLGYTVADFEEAILGNDKSLKKLEVYSVEISDVVTTTEAGLGKFAVFSKSQIITYNGVATYTVDLSQLKKSSISYDKKSNVVTLTVPFVELDDINIPSKDVEFGELNKGKLAFGKIKMTPEQANKLETKAEKQMRAKLKKNDVISEAEKMAAANIYSLYQPLINKIAPGTNLEVSFE